MTSRSLDLPLPPGSFGFPILGETGDWARDPLLFAQQRHQRYGMVWRTHLLGRPCAVLLGPEANRFILSSHIHLFSSRQGWGKPITNLIGGGLSLLDGPTHRRHRAMIMSTLHGAAIEGFFEPMQHVIIAHSATWLRSGEVRLFDGFKRLSFEIAMRVILGVEDASEIEAFFYPFKTFTRGLFAPPAWRIPGLPYERAWRAGHRMRAKLAHIIAEQRALPRASVLSALIAACDADGNRLSDAELIDELLVLLWAGHDTITALLTWLMYELLHHPAIYADLVAEQLEVGGKKPLTPEQLKQFPKLDRVLREAERLHPPAPGGFRGVVESFEYGGYRIPAGWTVMYSSVFTHHMPELWPNPKRFDPERFAARGGAVRPFSLIGFGGGPRICVGLAFAQMQMRMIMAQILRATCMTLVPGQRFDPIPVPTKMPRDGLIVACLKR